MPELTPEQEAFKSVLDFAHAMGGLGELGQDAESVFMPVLMAEGDRRITAAGIDFPPLAEVFGGRRDEEPSHEEEGSHEGEGS